MGKITNADIERAERELAEMKAKHHNCILYERYRHVYNKELVLGIREIVDGEDDMDEFKTDCLLHRKLKEAIEGYIREISQT